MFSLFLAWNGFVCSVFPQKARNTKSYPDCLLSWDKCSILSHNVVCTVCIQNIVAEVAFLWNSPQYLLLTSCISLCIKINTLGYSF